MSQKTKDILTAIGVILFIAFLTVLHAVIVAKYSKPVEKIVVYENPIKDKSTCYTDIVDNKFVMTCE